MLLGKFLEMEYPVADRVVPQIRKVQTFLEKVSGNNELRQTVRTNESLDAKRFIPALETQFHLYWPTVHQ